MPNPVKKPRIKTVFKTSEIAHLWAHQAYSCGRNPQGNFYFNGRVIYSYGTHFPIARLIAKPGDPHNWLALMTIRSYGPITSKHICQVRAAISHMTVFHVDDVMAGGGVLNQFKAYAKEKWEEVQQKRLAKSYGIAQFDTILKEANEYAELFSLSTRLKRPADYMKHLAIGQKWDDGEKVRSEARNRRNRERWEEEQRIAKLKFEEALPEWLAGRIPHLPYNCGLHLTYLRLIRSNKFIETSLGAVVPVSDAIALWHLAERCRKRGCTLRDFPGRPDAFCVGSYQLSEIDAKGNVRVGCHTLTWDIMLGMAQQLGIQSEA